MFGLEKENWRLKRCQPLLRIFEQEYAQTCKLRVQKVLLGKLTPIQHEAGCLLWILTLCTPFYVNTVAAFYLDWFNPIADSWSTSFVLIVVVLTIHLECVVQAFLSHIQQSYQSGAAMRLQKYQLNQHKQVNIQSNLFNTTYHRHRNSKNPHWLTL